MAFFTVNYRSSASKARLGKISTSHGQVATPTFVPVATKGTIKGLPVQLINEVKPQLAFVNTYHLVTHPGADVVEQAGGIHAFSKLPLPLMSDSGGFQVFSLAQNSRKANVRGDEQPIVKKISEDGVKFRSLFDGEEIEFTPESSMRFQQQIGADINMAFDECTYYPATEKYTEKAMLRTHDWLNRCISYVSNNKSSVNPRQYLYGVIQGGTSKKYREQSAEFVVSQNTPGVAIGGVSVGETKEEMRDQVKWVSPYLPQDRPVHLLGVGHIDDIIDLVKYGIDTFDCVEPTRIARMGTIYRLDRVLAMVEDGGENWEVDLMKGQFRRDVSRLDDSCNCYVCNNYTKAYIHHLFKQKELLGYTLATYHNLAVMEKLMEKIRINISGGII